NYAQGVYNACRRVLIRHTQEQGPVPPPHGDQACSAEIGSKDKRVERDLMLEYSNPFPDRNGVFQPFPPLWLTALGHDGFWPVALLDGNNGPAGNEDRDVLRGPQPTRDSRFRLERPSSFWNVLLTIVVCWSAGTIWCIAWMNLPAGVGFSWLRDSAGRARRFDFFRQFALDPENSSDARIAQLLVILVTLFAANTLF